MYQLIELYFRVVVQIYLMQLSVLGKDYKDLLNPEYIPAMSPSIAVILASLNEEQGIVPTICELREALSQPNLIVVDGKSSDRTLELAKDLGVKVVIQKGYGKGNAVYEGLKHLNNNTKYVAFTDADYTYPAKYLKEMINILD